MANVNLKGRRSVVVVKTYHERQLEREATEFLRDRGYSRTGRELLRIPNPPRPRSHHVRNARKRVVLSLVQLS